ncbi:MAG: phosphoribosyltransferase family protein [Sphingomonas sp.]
MGFGSTEITKAALEQLATTKPKRVCFGTTHTNALKKSPSGPKVGYFNLPFSETFDELLPWALTSGKYGFFVSADTAARFNQIQGWIDQHREMVFIKSLLNSAVALSFQYSEEGRTPIGELEYQAKYCGNKDATSKLSEIAIACFASLFQNRNINGIISVPPTDPDKNGLPQLVAKAISNHFEIENFTSRISWSTKKPSIKSASLSEKWDILSSIGITIDTDISKRNIMIIDDMYQSGTTVHYVASRLRASDACDIHCLSLSKSLSDKDNQ